EPRPPDRRIGAGFAAAPEPGGCLIPAAALDGQSGLAQPDTVVLRRQLAGLVQGPLQAVVRHPGQVEIAELLEIAGRILRLHQAGAVQGSDVVKSDLDLIDLTQQIAGLVAARAVQPPDLLEAPSARA